MANLFDALPAAPTSAEAVDVLLTRGSTRIERIVSFGHRTDWYDQDCDEWVAVLAGEGVLEFADGSRRVMGPGDHEFLPSHVRHRVASTAADRPTVWLAVFTG